MQKQMTTQANGIVFELRLFFNHQMINSRLFFTVVVSKFITFNSSLFRFSFLFFVLKSSFVYLLQILNVKLNSLLSLSSFIEYRCSSYFVQVYALFISSFVFYFTLYIIYRFQMAKLEFKLQKIFLQSNTQRQQQQKTLYFIFYFLVFVLCCFRTKSAKRFN